MMWNIWAKALGQKAHSDKKIANQVAWIRTFIFLSYLITNCFIVAGVIRHWDDKPIIIIDTTESHFS